MAEHVCNKEEFLGEVKEFINNSKGLKATMFTIAMAVLLQVGTFLYFWGRLTTTVEMHDKNINRIMTKLDNVKIIGLAYAETKEGIEKK